MTEHSGRGLWRNSGFVVLLSGQWVSRAGDVLFQMAVAWYVLNISHSVAALGVVGGVGALARLFTLLAGVFVDRWDRLRTMIVTDIVRAALAFLAAGLAALGVLGVPALVAVVFILAMAGTLFSPAEMAVLPQVVEERDLAGANGANESASSLAQLLGMGLGGALLALLGPVLLFATNGISFIASVASLGWLRRSAERAPSPPRERVPLGLTVRGIARDVAAGQRVLWTHPFLRRAIPVAIIVNFSLMPLNTLDVAWVRQVLHLGAYAYALFGIAIVAGVLAGGVMAGPLTRRVPLRSVIVGGLVVAGIAVAALSQLPMLGADLALLLLFGIAFGLVNVATSTAVQMAVPSQVMGRVGGAMIAASGLAVPLGAFLAGFGAASVSIEAVFLGTGALLLLGGALFLGVPETMTAIAEGEASR